MRHLRFALAVFVLAGCAHPDRAEIATGSVYKVYFLGGQSNMEGAGYTRDLPAGVVEAAASVPIFHEKRRKTAGKAVAKACGLSCDRAMASGSARTAG